MSNTGLAQTGAVNQHCANNIGANRYDKRADFPGDAEMREKGGRDDETNSALHKTAAEGGGLYLILVLFAPNHLLRLRFSGAAGYTAALWHAGFEYSVSELQTVKRPTAASSLLAISASLLESLLVVSATC